MFLKRTFQNSARIASRQNNILRIAPSVQLRDKHTLPGLKFPVQEGVEPLFSGHQMNFHYNKHHKTYVEKLNELIAGTEFESQPLDQIIRATAFDAAKVAVFNNAAQHFNHSFFWRCLKPNDLEKGEEHHMSEYVRKKFEKQFESVENFKKIFSEEAITLFGSGWVWLVWDGTQMKIWKGGNAACPIAENLVPILTVDVWEHSYYLDYQNRRAEYLNDFWKVVDWDFVETTMREVMAAQDVIERQQERERAKARREEEEGEGEEA